MSLESSQSEPAEPPASIAPRVPVADRLLAWGMLAGTAAVFWPVTRWMVAETVARSQIRQAFILLAFAAGMVGWEHRKELRFAGDLCGRTLALLATAFVLAGAAAVKGWSLLVLPALALALAGCLQLYFGPGGYRFFRPLVAGVVAFLLIILAFPLVDWPLRQLAGVGAANVLHLMEVAPQLRLGGTPGDPQLVLSVAGGNFLVATECNGFGLITSSGLLAILAGGISGRRWWTIAWLLPVALLAGFVFNVLRILVISLGAQYLPGHYNALHEVAGLIALWTGLGAVGLLAWRPIQAAVVAARRPASV